jgi:arsenite-transporting ATPase
MRILLMCGKGGVGKTTLAAALGARSAAAGKKTLIFSIDPAHSLSSIVGTPLGAEPVSLGDRLWGAELAAMDTVDADWSELKNYFLSLLESQGLDSRLGDDLVALPGIDEFAALLSIKKFHDSGLYDVLVVDNAPTGFALRLLSLPAVASWYGTHAMKLYERHMPSIMLMAPMMGTSVPFPPGTVIAQAVGLIDTLKDLPLLFSDPAVTSLRLVLSAERLALEEARNTYKHLALYGLLPDAVLVNQVLPDAVKDPFFAPRQAREAAVLAQAALDFAPLPLWRVPLESEEVTGLQALQALGQAIWPLGDPTAAQSSERAITVTQEAGQVLVSLKLPYTASKDVDLAKFENELYITIGNHRRTLLLPPEAARMQPIKAKFVEGRLLVTLA